MFARFYKLKNLLRNRAIILAYHRVADVAFDPQLLCVSPKNFAEQLDYICSAFKPVSLVSLSDQINKNTIQHKSLVITFDDGYRDNFVTAKEILEQYRVPATIFVTTSKFGNSCGFWWDELEQIILLRKNFPTKIRLCIDGKDYAWIFDSNSIEFANFKDWNVSYKIYPHERFKFYKQLHLMLKPLPTDQIMKVIKDLKDQVPVGECFYDKDFKIISQTELHDFKSNLIDVGSHTVTHPMLSRQSDAVQEYEICQSRKILGDIMKKEIETFSYPFGGLDDIDNVSTRFAEHAGYKCAVANFADNVYSNADIYKLPRFLVRNWSGVEFEAMMNKWFYGN